MKRTLGLVGMVLGETIGLVVCYAGASLLFSQLAFGGTQNILLDAAFILVGGGLAFLAARWGAAHEKRALAILAWVGTGFILGLGIRMLFKFAGSFPTPPDAWLQSMAFSRANTLGVHPAIDDKLVIQGRLVTGGIAILSLLFSIPLGWFGKLFWK